MRYIRTENGKIYDTIEDKRIRLGRNDETHEITFYLCGVSAFSPHVVLDVIDQADTVDELCDCYLEDCGRGVPAIITKTMWVDFHMEKAFRGETAFYACIVKRDEKGTHINPVAKLNEKMGWDLL